LDVKLFKCRQTQREDDDEDKVSRKKLSSSLAQTHSRDIRYLCQ